MDNNVQKYMANIQAIEEKIDRAKTNSGRNTECVRLVIVTKTQPVDVVQGVIDAGGRYLGENYPEETVEKIPSLRLADGVEFHMIGHLQSRKSRLVVDHFHMLHSLDSLKLAKKVNSLIIERAKSPLPVLLQCNVSGEESKGGFSAWDEEKWELLLPEIENIISLPGLKVNGLMTMPPLFINDPEKVRQYFRKLRKLKDYFASNFPQADWKELSMGTSSDFEIAIEEGATFVRIGTSIVGERRKKNI